MDGLVTIQHDYSSDFLESRKAKHPMSEQSRQKQKEWYERSFGAFVRNERWRKCYSGREEYETL